MLLALSSNVVAAQEITGWTSLEWSASSQTLYGYAETDLDDYAAAFYAAALNTSLFNSSGTLLASASSSRSTDEDFADLEISAPGSAGQTYTQNTEHLAIIQYSSDCALPCRNLVYYQDYYNYSSFASQDGGVNFNDDLYLFGPGPQVETRTSAPPVPPTHSSSTASSQTCGDVRDTIKAEYVSYRVGFQPQCNYFDTDASSEYFVFSQYNYPSRATAPAKYPYAILTQQLLGFADNWYTRVTFPITSGYRCPSQNLAAGGTHNSNHMRGIAIDAGNTGGTSTTWNTLLNASKAAGADWTEPQIGPCKLACVHGDLRYHPATYVYP